MRSLDEYLGDAVNSLRCGEWRAVLRVARRVTWIRPRTTELLAILIRGSLTGQTVTLIPPLPDGPRLHVGAGQQMLEGYENLDAYDNTQRPDFFQTPVKKFVRAETLDLVYEPESVAEIRGHHVLEHIGILDVDRAMRGWNRILKPGGLLWLEVPDFGESARAILSRRSEACKEIYYRDVFGSQFSQGEFHRNGFTAQRLMAILDAYGFETRVAYVLKKQRIPRKPDMYYPTNPPLPDLTVKAIKVRPPDPALSRAEFTHIAYRRTYPNPELEDGH
jgi:hypothetical protein